MGLILPITKLGISIIQCRTPTMCKLSHWLLYSISYKKIRNNFFFLTCQNCRPWVFEWQTLPEEVNHNTIVWEQCLYLYYSFLTLQLYLNIYILENECSHNLIHCPIESKEWETTQSQALAFRDLFLSLHFFTHLWHLFREWALTC